MSDLLNSYREVGLDTTPAAGNIAAKPLLPHTPTNQQYVPLTLPITDHPQEESIDSLENQGISSIQNPTKNQGYFELLSAISRLKYDPGKHQPKTSHAYKPRKQSYSSIRDIPSTKSREPFDENLRYFEQFTTF